MRYVAYVDADHVSPRFTFRNHPVTVIQDAGRWYCTSSGLGCSRDYLSAEEAIYSLFQANACANIKINHTENSHAQ